MRFGSWVFPISQNSKNDGHVIDDTLTEIDRWEALGFDSIWLSEHHFDGATAYADPVVFAGAIAQRTKNVTIGFAVVEMALHHPVRLAAQVASHRCTVGLDCVIHVPHACTVVRKMG